MDVAAAAEHAPWIWLAVSGLLALALLFWGFWSLKRKRLIENVPTSKVKGVFLGLNEVKGRARRDDPIISFLAEQPCVYYRYSIDEKWSRTVTYTDSKGNTRTRTESGWTTVDSDEVRQPFFLEDSTGALRIVPHGAEIKADRVFSETCSRMNGLYYGKGPDTTVANSDGIRRFVEHAIPLGARIYVMGNARLRDDVVEPEIAHHRDAEMFLISTDDEKQLTRGYTLGAGFKLAFGTIAAGAFPIGLALDRVSSVEAAFRAQLPTCLAFAGAYAAVILVYYLVLVYNGLVSVRQRQRMAESMIEVQLRRRHTLIPRLVECVKGYARHEQGTQERLAALRAGKDDTAGQNRALRTIFALAEAYPDLDADENFAALQRELVNTEDKIALAREFCNESVTALRNRIETMPDALVAKLTGFKAKDWAAARDFERTPVRIDLGN